MTSDDDRSPVGEAGEDWDPSPVHIERRPTGKQVVSARLPTALARRLLDVAARRGLRPSDLIREALESYFDPAVGIEALTVSASRMRFARLFGDYATEIPGVTTWDARSEPYGALVSANH